MPHGAGKAAGFSPRGHRAFSLAELMIALVILGLGLLFIAAALPVGLEYTRQTVDKANADAAAACALDQLELNLRTAGNRLYDPSVDAAGTASRLDMIHRPRDYQVPAGLPDGREYPLAPKYEPLIKVWPFSLGNVRFEPPSGAAATREIADNVDDVNSAIRAYLLAVFFPVPTASTSWPLEAGFGRSVLPRLCSAANQVLPGLARVYPPIEPITSFSVEGFFNGSDNDDFSTYAARFNIMSWQEMDRERSKALDRRIAWTAFYRRVAYDEPGPNLFFEAPGATTSDDAEMEELLYEIIVVVTQRVSLNHRFPRQDLTVGPDPFESPRAYNPNNAPGDDAVFGTDRVAPTPWLVTFDSGANNPPLPLLETFGSNLYVGNDRTILANTSFDDPATLTFRCTPEVGALLPVGSIFIPALNDNHRRVSGLANPPPWAVVAPAAGFVPHTPQTLPIYEVVERPDVTTVVVKNNGHYPWVATGIPSATQAWPVWVIPPAFVQRDSNGQPVYERSSPILKVVRRTVSLHEVNR